MRQNSIHMAIKKCLILNSFSKQFSSFVDADLKTNCVYSGSLKSFNTLKSNFPLFG